MTGWVKFENVMPENIKIERSSDRAFRLWVAGICFASRAKSDGFIPISKVLNLTNSATEKTVAELVNSGLFERVDGGYLVHNYLRYNPSSQRIRELQASSRDSTAKWRDKQRDEDVTRHANESDASQARHSRARARNRSYVLEREELEREEPVSQVPNSQVFILPSGGSRARGKHQKPEQLEDVS